MGRKDSYFVGKDLGESWANTLSGFSLGLWGKDYLKSKRKTIKEKYPKSKGVRGQGRKFSFERGFASGVKQYKERKGITSFKKWGDI